jgi:hypothetical protein
MNPDFLDRLSEASTSTATRLEYRPYPGEEESVWRLAAVLLALCIAAGVSSSMARAKDVEIKITVVGHDGKPAGGADLSITMWSGDNQIHTEKMTGDDGTVTLRVPDGVLVDVEAHEGSGVEQRGVRSINLKRDKERDLTIRLYVDLKTEVILINEAVENCDADGYDKHLRYVEDEVAKKEARFEERRKQVEKYASDNGIPTMDHKSAEEAREAIVAAAGKGDGLRATSQKLQNLSYYSYLLQGLESEKRGLDELKKLRDGLPKRPACKTGSMAPGTCPPGTSGGLLAGGLNDVFGTDLQTHCEPPQRHNDTRDKHDDKRQKD